MPARRPAITKRERHYKHVLESMLERGTPLETATRVAAATVNAFRQRAALQPRGRRSSPPAAAVASGTPARPRRSESVSSSSACLPPAVQDEGRHALPLPRQGARRQLAAPLGARGSAASMSQPPAPAPTPKSLEPECICTWKLCGTGNFRVLHPRCPMHGKPSPFTIVKKQMARLIHEVGVRIKLRRYWSDAASHCTDGIGYHNACAPLRDVDGVVQGSSARPTSGSRKTIPTRRGRRCAIEAWRRRPRARRAAGVRRAALRHGVREAGAGDLYLRLLLAPDARRVLVLGQLRRPAPHRGPAHREEWDIDGRANNCSMLEDRTHRCWVRHGEPPDVTVDKDGPTCTAGRGLHPDPAVPRHAAGRAVQEV